MFHNKGIYLLMVLFVSFNISFAQETGNNTVDILIDSGHYFEAIKLLEGRINHDSLKINLYHKTGDVYKLGHRKKKALYFYQKALTLDQNNLRSLTKYADCCFSLSLLDIADSCYNRLAQNDSMNISAHSQLARISYIQQKYQEAYERYYFLNQLDSINPYLCQKMADCKLALNDVPNAVDLYKKSLELDADQLSTSLKLAEVLHKNDELDSALLYIDKALIYKPDNLNLLKKKANLLYLKTKYNDAIPFYHKVLLAGDSAQAILRQLGISYYNVTADTGQSVEILLQSANLKPDDGLTAFYLGLSYRRHHNLEKSIEWLQKAIELLIPAQTTLYYVELGNSQILNGQNYKGLESYKRAYWYSPSRKEILIEIAVVYENYMGDMPKALKYFEQFTEEYSGKDQELLDYAKSKITQIKEELHFKGAK